MVDLASTPIAMLDPYFSRGFGRGEVDPEECPVRRLDRLDMAHSAPVLLPDERAPPAPRHARLSSSTSALLHLLDERAPPPARRARSSCSPTRALLHLLD